ncbi:MAG: PaaI family thioesterase [Rhodobacteraceae bacterium]|nr:PaaI family thioesterase [Paracoccaceae bacterium]
MPEQHVARSPADLPGRDQIAAMTGLEYIQGICDGTHAGAPIAEVMNFRLHEVARGEVAFRGAPEFRHFNPMGGVHGGWYGTILDSALGCAVATTLDRGSAYTTLEYKVNLTRALKPGVEVECRARVQHTGRSTAVAEATIVGVEDGKIYATGSTTCIIMRA